MTGLTAIFAQDSKPAETGQKQPELPFFANPFFMVAVVVLFFFVVLIPNQRRQKKEQQQLLASLKAGSKVLTSSGILGTIVKIKDGEEEVVLRSEDAKIRVLRASITKVLGEETTEQK